MQRKQKSAATIGYHEAINILPGYHPAESERRSQGESEPSQDHTAACGEFSERFNGRSPLRNT